MKKDLQYGFSEHYSDVAFSRPGREKKAEKVLAILRDAIGPLEGLRLLDVGCSTGFMTRCYARHFGSAVGTDIDLPALRHAKDEATGSTLDWLLMDSQNLAFRNETFDVVTCTHIYEHVPDAEKLMAEIYRVLKPGGVCFFSAGNRFSLIEPHYRLPLLSVVPKAVAHVYLRVLGRGRYYYEKHLTLAGLRRLVGDFEIIDYTIAAVRSPERFRADDVIKPGGLKRLIALALLRFAYALCPTYLWVLRKKA
jgi:2-polyprenyl-3-methyl-5-hydroxy-6-metoxy-1,4-benzoquinol methylase